MRGSIGATTKPHRGLLQHSSPPPRQHRKQAERERYLAGIGQVAAVIVHDLKNPLIAILGFARRIREGKGDSAPGAQTIEDSAQNMQGIVNSVLDFAKPLQLNFKDVDIRDVIRRAGESCRAKAEARGVTLTMHVPDTPVTTAIDGCYFERSLINLIDNAVDASPRESRVEVAAAIVRGQIVITVKDEGSGMDRKTLENLFVPFHTTKSEGTGLGMPISRKDIEAHAGSLDIHSKQGAGTQVVLRVPFLTTVFRQNPDSTSAAIPGQVAPSATATTRSTSRVFLGSAHAESASPPIRA